jgi:hypothetical protein
VEKTIFYGRQHIPFHFFFSDCNRLIASGLAFFLEIGTYIPGDNLRVGIFYDYPIIDVFPLSSCAPKVPTSPVPIVEARINTFQSAHTYLTDSRNRPGLA